MISWKDSPSQRRSAEKLGGSAFAVSCTLYQIRYTSLSVLYRYLVTYFWSKEQRYCLRSVIAINSMHIIMHD